VTHRTPDQLLSLICARDHVPRLCGADSDMEFVFFVNCGASVDVNELGMKADISCIVIDHHRPIHPANAWNANVLVPLPEVTWWW
jgi:hypothetical protein